MSADNESRLHSHARASRMLIGWTCAALLIFYLLGFPGYTRCPFTCAVCRADKVDYHLLGLKWSKLEDEDCSRWYSDNVERSHTHVWIRGSYCRRFGIPGVWGGYSCVIGGPLTGLSKNVQRAIYQHFDDPLEGKRLFIRLGRTDAETFRVWTALMGWVDADYPGTWDAWWKQHAATEELRVDNQ
jgi:hypothetical protein